MTVAKTVAGRHAEFAVAMRGQQLPAEAVHHAKRCVIDWFAATLPGGLEAPATLMTRALAEDIGRGAASLLPSGAPATARTAALINGTASHTIEFDDIFRDGLYHPGSPVIAAALAAAQQSGASGEMVLRGVISGYEISNRIAAAMVPAHYDWWHTTATVGFFGAAAASATILDLDEKQAAHALGTVGTMAAGLQQAFRADAMSKPIHAGRAAEGGLTAALLAAEGITGALDILEGERGFGNAMSVDVDWAPAVKGLGEDFTITRITQKNHAACGHLHASIDAVLALRAAHGLTPETVKRIDVGSYQKSKEICGNGDPKTPYEAKFSTQYCAALALRTGQSLRTRDFTAELVADGDLRAVMARVSVEVDEGCQAAFPQARSAEVEIETTDGRVLSHFAPTRKGDPDAPLSDEELADKYRDLATPVIGAAGAGDLLGRLWRLDTLASVTDLGLSRLGTPDAAAAE
jgi:2-methylcitrate dehydratase PrpD